MLNPHRGQIYLEKPFFRGGEHSLAKIAIYLPGMILLSFIFIVPAAYQGIKAILLIVIISEILLNTLMAGRFHMNPTIFLLFMFYLMLGLLYGFYGFLRGNLGALPVTKEIVFYVFIYMFLITGVRNEFSLKCIHYTIIFSATFLTFYIAISILNVLSIWPNFLYYNLFTSTTSTQTITTNLISRGQFDIGMINLPSLMFLQPYLLAYYLSIAEKTPKYIWLLIILMTLIMVFSGSRILFIVALFFMLIIGIFFLIYGKGKKHLLQRIMTLCLVSVISMAIFYHVLKQIGFDANLFIGEFLEAFQPLTLEGEQNVRFGQFNALLHGWMENPVFGVGSGGVQWDYIRSGERPWSYELSYMKFLFDWGVVGIILYGSGLAFVCIKSLAIYERKHALGSYTIAMSIGQIVFLFGAATNPLVLKFDSLAIFFLPIAVINLVLLSNKHPLVTTQISQDNRTL